MDAVNVLNNYRTAVASDPEAVIILALLYRSGPQEESKLGESTKLGLRRVRLKLNELFRAHLVCLVMGNRWVTTDLADEILARLGIAEVAAISLLFEQDINEEDRSFLQACAVTRASKNSEWSRHQTAFLRNLDDLKQDTLKLASKKELASLLFAGIVGLDTEAQQLGGENYCNYIFDWHSRKESDLWAQWKEKWVRNQNRYIQYCDDAFDLAFDSNMVFFEGDSGVLKERPSRLALLRVLSAMTSNVLDPGMEAVSHVNREFSSDVWIILDKAFPGVEERAGKVLRLRGKTDPDLEGNLLTGLRVILESVFQKYWGSSRVATPLPSTKDMREVLNPVRGNWLEGMLLRLKAQIEAGDYDHLPEKTGKRLTKLFEEAKSAFDQRVALGNSKETANASAAPDANRAPRGRRR